MKTNFKKLALVAGVSAAMAAGSMPAHAAIQAVPAPAALIPLVLSGDVDGKGRALASVTNFRIEVPSSVGLDSVVNLFGGPNATPAGGIPSSGVAVGLATSVSSAASSATSKLHWYFMDKNSNEVIDAAFPVSANDVIEFNSNAMANGQSAGVPLPAGVGYLVIINDSASLGGAPLFSFQADAFITTTLQNNTTLVNNVPVYPLTDTVDNQAASPTLANNVLEDVSGVPGGAPYGGGPIVSPLMSGIRLAAANASGATQGWYRVIDFPINGSNSSTNPNPGEYYVVWNDRNESVNIVNGAVVETPGVEGSIVSYDCNENQQSGTALSLNNQLNIVHIEPPTAPTVAASIAPPVADSVYSDLSMGNAGNCVTANTGPGGFVRWFAEPNPNNVGGLTSAAYQAGVIFRLRQAAADGYSQFPVDRGFFTAK